VVLAAIDSDAYKIVLILHITAVVVGIGAVFLNALYGAQAKARRGPEGLAIAEANLRVSTIAEWIIYTIPVSGIALVLMSKTDGTRLFDFDQTWIWLSIVLYVVAMGISHGVVMPTAKKMNALMRELDAMGPPMGAGGPPPQVVQLEAFGKRIGAAGASLNVLTVVLIFLMVWKPGF
jgi:uncharacterized membrane protein